MQKGLSLILVMLFGWIVAYCQYPPHAGQSGTTAIHQDSSAFIGWANGFELQRGYLDITNKSKGFATVGNGADGLGKPDYSVVSLGDSGIITLSFDGFIENGPGFDFAVFENSFSDFFLELAHVEVSSNGTDFVRFPSISLTDTAVQTGSFDSTYPTLIHNLAGKYRGTYGTPFDLEDLKDSVLVNVHNITHVRLIDVIGSVQKPYATRDSEGRMINDPFKTDFPSGGFDLDGIGVINGEIYTGIAENEPKSLVFYPNPAKKGQKLTIIDENRCSVVRIYDLQGNLILSLPPNNVENDLNAGLYVLQLIDSQNHIYETQKLLICE